MAAISLGSRDAARVAFVLPRADWIASNAGLIRMLMADADASVALVCPDAYAPPPDIEGGCAIFRYPFFAAGPECRGWALVRETYARARERRQRIDEFLATFAPHCIIVISTTSRELLPWVRLARLRSIKVVQIQSAFLAPDLRQHVWGENRRLVSSRGVTGMARLVTRYLIERAAGLPATLLKSAKQAAGADRVFVINAVQQRIYAEHMPVDRIDVTGTPMIDHLHQQVSDAAGLSSSSEFRARWRIPANAPIALYVSKSLAKFCHVAAEQERAFQAFAIRACLERLTDAIVLVKLHPIEDASAFVDVEQHPRVRVLKDGDIHELLHHAQLVISLGTSTPAIYAIFHGRPRLIVREADGVDLGYQRQLIDVSASAQTRGEFEAALDELRTDGWPRTAPARFTGGKGTIHRAFAADEADGTATVRVHARLRAFLDLAIL